MLCIFDIIMCILHVTILFCNAGKKHKRMDFGRFLFIHVSFPFQVLDDEHRFPTTPGHSQR